jgi:hypothetical protein
MHGFVKSYFKLAACGLSLEAWSLAPGFPGGWQICAAHGANEPRKQHF